MKPEISHLSLTVRKLYLCNIAPFNLPLSSSILATPPSPGQPFLVKAQSTSITIGWSETACDGGHPLLSFNLQYDKVYGYFPSRTIRNIDPTRRNYTITGLTSNTYYRFKVQAVSVNSRTSFYSSTVSIYTLAPGKSCYIHSCVILYTDIVH